MAKIPHITNASGTNLKKYKLKHLSDETEESVELVFDPSSDYVVGTPFNEATMNPIIDEVNRSDFDVEAIEELQVDEECEFDSLEEITSVVSSDSTKASVSYEGLTITVVGVGVGSCTITINGTKVIPVSVIA